MDSGGIMYVPAKEIPVYTSLTDAPKTEALTSGKKLYQQHCAPCHGADLWGNHSGAYPALAEVGTRISGEQIHLILKKGQGMMPAFTHLALPERTAFVSF